MKTLVLAGNYRDFERWCWDNKRNPKDRNTIFLDEPLKMRGLDNTEWTVSVLPSYLDNPYYLVMLDYIRERSFMIVWY